MPNRIIKESICYSDDLDSLTPFEETVFYRLLVRVDDYGRIDARPSFLKSMLFVTKQGVTEKNIKEAVARMASVGLVRLYEVDGKSFLSFPKWHLHQRLRNSREKYPAPLEADAENSSSPQLAANGGEKQLACAESQSQSQSESESQSQSQSQSESESQSDAHTREGGLDAFHGDLRDTVSDWFAYKAEKRQGYKPVGRKSLIAEIKTNADRYGSAAVVEVIRQSMSSNYQGIVWDKLKNKPLQAKKANTLGVLEAMLQEEGGDGRDT